MKKIRMYDCIVAMSNPSIDPLCTIESERLYTVKKDGRTENQTLKLDEAKERELIKEQAKNADRLVRLVETGTIDMLKGAELKELCRIYDAKQTGNKTQLKHNLKQVYDDFINGGFCVNETLTGNGISITPTLYGYIISESYVVSLGGYNRVVTDYDLISTEEGENWIAEYVATTKAYIPAVVGAIKSIARRSSCHSGGDACRQIVDKHFSEPIYEDIKQECFLALLSLIRGNAVSVNGGKVTYKHGLSWTFDGIYKCLDDYRQKTEDMKKRGFVSYTADGQEMICSQTGSKVIPYLSKVACLDDILNNQCLIDFLRFVHRKEREDVADRITHVLASRIEGRTQEQTAEYLGIGVATVRRYEALLKVLYVEFDTVICPQRDSADNKDYGCQWSLHSDAKDSYDFCYSVGTSASLTGYQTGEKQTAKKGSGTQADILRDMPAIIPDGRKEKAPKHGKAVSVSSGRLTDWSSVTVSASATWGRKSAERRNKQLLRLYPDYYRKHPEKLIPVSDNMNDEG